MVNAGKEVEKQLDAVDKEIIFVSSQLNERELDVKKLQETVNTLLKIDGIVTPFKSKDTLLQILQIIFENVCNIPKHICAEACPEEYYCGRNDVYNIFCFSASFKTDSLLKILKIYKEMKEISY